MPRFCAVVGCSNRSDRESEKKYFSFPGIRDRRNNPLPEGVRRRQLWINSLHREDFPEQKVKHARICSDHFLSGYPSEDPLNPDYIPHINMGYGTAENPASKRARFDRATKRSLKRSLQVSSTQVKDVHSVIPSTSKESGIDLNIPSEEQSAQVNTAGTQVLDQSTQTEDIYSQLLEDLRNSNETIYNLRIKLEVVNNTAESFAGNNEKTKFFTGLPTYKSLEMIVGLIYNYLPPSQALTPFQQILLNLMRLRLNSSFRFLGYHFNIHETTATRIFLKTLNVMYYRLKNFIIWPSREEVAASMPDCFKVNFGNKVVVIIDCFEVKIEKSKNLLAQASTWSNYKHDNTMKILIGITPHGSISYISDAYGGRISDKKIAEDCGILNNLLPGDVVLADRGFLIQEIVKVLHGADVQTPAFVKGKQLKSIEVESTRRLAAVRIHVERVIGLLRQKYQILHNTVPISMLRQANKGVGVIDQILTVCAALVNLCPGIVPE